MGANCMSLSAEQRLGAGGRVRRGGLRRWSVSGLLASGLVFIGACEEQLVSPSGPFNANAGSRALDQKDGHAGGTSGAPLANIPFGGGPIGGDESTPDGAASSAGAAPAELPSHGGGDNTDVEATGKVHPEGEAGSQIAAGGAPNLAANAIDASVAAPANGLPERPDVDWPLINGVQWADTDGNPIQAHGGGMLKVGEDYYWYGENRNPDGTFYAVSAYRSRDLRSWEHVNDVLTMASHPGLKPANVERPKVVYNAATKKYVMWMHWENGKGYGEARAAVASAFAPDGDYTFHGSFRPLQDTGVVDHGKPGYMSRDCTLFVDDDGKGYFLSTANENYDLHLYSLRDDYLSIESRKALLFAGEHREAPALFKRGATYFLLTSASTGWDPNQAKYATSSSLTGTWSSMQVVANSNTFYSQSAYVQAVAGSRGTEYLYMGDRWAGAWGGRVNDSSYVWQPISFPSNTTMSMSWFNDVSISEDEGSVAGTVSRFTFVNQKTGQVLSVRGAPDQNRAEVIQNEKNAAQADAWRLNYNGAGHFRITSDSGGKVLDVPGESTEAGIKLHLWDDNGGDHQAWHLKDVGHGLYRIRNKKSGHYLAVSGANAEAAVEQQRESAGDEQVWRLVAQ